MKKNQTIKISTNYFCSLLFSGVFLFSFCSFKSLTTIDINKPISYADVDINCMNLKNLQSIYIIRDESDLNKNADAPTSCDIGKIDFNKYTLIGSVAICKGSLSPIITKTVSYNEEEKKIHFQVEITEQGTHGSQSQTANYWVLIPKIAKEVDVISNINLHFLPEE